MVIHEPRDLTAAWLGAVLAAPVATVRCRPVNARATSSLVVRADVGGRSVVVKLASRDAAVREHGRDSGAYRREVDVLGTLLPGDNGHTPRIHDAAYDPTSGDFHIVMADGSDQLPYSTEAGLTRDAVAAVVDWLAALHAAWWDRAELALVAEPVLHRRPTPERVDRFVDRCRAYLHPRAIAALRALTADWSTVAGRLSSARTLCHGDVHPLNVLAVPGGGMRLVDWQFSLAANPQLDLAYLLCLCLHPADRRLDLAQLLERYCDGLHRGGVRGYPVAVAARDLRLAAALHLATAVGLSELPGLPIEGAVHRFRQAYAAFEDLGEPA